MREVAHTGTPVSFKQREERMAYPLPRSFFQLSFRVISVDSWLSAPNPQDPRGPRSIRRVIAVQLVAGPYLRRRIAAVVVKVVPFVFPSGGLGVRHKDRVWRAACGCRIQDAARFYRL